MAAPLAAYLLSILGLVAVTGYALFRLNSTQIIREKVWSSLVGDKDFNDERLKSFACDQLDLARFRVVYGVAAQSVKDLHRLLSWMERYKVSPLEVKRVRGWIDASREGLLKVPSRRYVAMCVVVLGILILGFTSSGRSASSKATWFRMNTSGTWFSSDGTSVNAIWGGWRIDSQQCAKHVLPDAAVTGLSGDEAASICKAMVDGELKTMVSDSLKGQRWSLGAISLFIVLLYGCAVMHISVVLRARRLGNRLLPMEKAQGGREQPRPETGLMGM